MLTFNPFILAFNIDKIAPLCEVKLTITNEYESPSIVLDYSKKKQDVQEAKVGSAADLHKNATCPT